MRKLTDLRVKNQVLRTGLYRTLYTSEDVIVFERYLDNEGRDAFGNTVLPSQSARKIIVVLNRGSKGVYFSFDDSEKEFKVSEIEKASVDFASETIVNGVSFGPMQVGVAPLSALFVVYG